MRWLWLTPNAAASSHNVSHHRRKLNGGESSTRVCKQTARNQLPEIVCALKRYIPHCTRRMVALHSSYIRNPPDGLHSCRTRSRSSMTGGNRATGVGSRGVFFLLAYGPVLARTRSASFRHFHYRAPTSRGKEERKRKRNIERGQFIGTVGATSRRRSRRLNDDKKQTRAGSCHRNRQRTRTPSRTLGNPR